MTKFSKSNIGLTIVGTAIINGVLAGNGKQGIRESNNCLTKL